jgi:hypothetical protein
VLATISKKWGRIQIHLRETNNPTEETTHTINAMINTMSIVFSVPGRKFADETKYITKIESKRKYRRIALFIFFLLWGILDIHILPVFGESEVFVYIDRMLRHTSSD